GAPSVASDMSIDFSYVVKFQEKVCTGSGGENRCGFLGAYEKSVAVLYVSALPLWDCPFARANGNTVA
ncbi:hypothetical protein, partial [Thiolapillus sp.]|uniref:hypothetical protein n=1 Tax=Thiolapillus sp. TaxID=2017437 RepID=UPI003AF88E26